MIKNVMVAKGLKIHFCPKVASRSISDAMYKVRYRLEYPIASGGYHWMVVRHPLDRLVSCWAFFCNGPNKAVLSNALAISDQEVAEPIGYKHGMTFGAFLNIALRKHDLNLHTVKQVEFAGHLDHICRLENLEEEWAVLIERFPFLRPLAHANKSDHNEWPKHYSSIDRQRAEEVFSEDVELFERACV